MKSYRIAAIPGDGIDNKTTTELVTDAVALAIRNLGHSQFQRLLLLH